LYVKAAFLTALLLFTVAIGAQETDGPKPDRWRGLILDQSTPADAIKTLGTPKKDREGGLRTYPLNKRLVLDHNSDGYRKLTYEDLEGIKSATLVFRNDRLVLIELHPKQKISATTLPNLYSIEFVPKVGQMETAMNPRNYERNQGRVYPKNYPVVYYLIAQTQTSYVSAMIENGGLGNILMGSSRGQAGAADTGGFPGSASIIQIISRKLENREGADVLK
jgi:hypothetical protein